MYILSALERGNGALIIHEALAAAIPGYRLCSFDPRWTLFPPALLGLCRAGAPDLVHAPADFAPLLARRGIPLVTTFHNFVLDPFMVPYASPLQRLHYRLDLRWLTNWSLRRATAVIAVSHFIADIVCREMGVEREIAVIYNGVDEARFAPRPAPEVQHGPLRVLFCGNLSLRKRTNLIRPLAEALGRGFQVLYTVGLRNGEPGGWTEAPVANLQCLGSVPHHAMPELYRSVDILFMPSIREGFGLCVAEAMACGLPVVAADASALPELVDHGKGGLLCPPDDLDAFADAVRTLADSPAKRAEMGAYNRAKVEALFTLERMVQEYWMLFERVLDGEIGSANGQQPATGGEGGR